MYIGTMKKVGIVSVLSVVMLVLVGFFTSMEVQADESDEPVIDEKWGKPVYVYGSEITEEEAKKLAEDNGYDFDSLDVYVVDGKDLVNYLGEGNEDSSMYSSVIIERKDSGYGIEVEIPEEDKITKIGESQYENAMTTSGVTDAKVSIVSPVAVTGESALTGIFKAYDEKGEELDKDRMELGQDELDITNEINEETGDDEESDQEDINSALVDIKQSLSEMEEGATKEDVEEVVNKVLDERGLDNKISEETKERLVEFADKYRNSSAIDSEEVKEQLEDLSKKAADKAKEVKEHLDDIGFWEKLGQFLKDILSAIGEFFSSLTSKDK